MRIAVVAHIRHPICEPFMGGMEAHAASLVAGLRDAGHDVDLLAAGGSADPQLIPICERPYEAVLPWERWRGTAQLDAYQELAFRRALSVIAEGNYDVVHNNSLFAPLIGWLAQEGIAAVTSQHVPPFGAMRDAVERHAGCDHVRITVTSASQLPLWGAASRHLVVAHNGVDCDGWNDAGRALSGHLAWSGRITPNKGTALALAAAHRAGASLDLYGPVEDASYFAGQIVPLLDDRRRYRGHISRSELMDEIGRAAAVLVTPTWDEPFGLVAAEALACGTPVIALDRGAMREVVGPCGFVVPAGSVEGIAQAIDGISGIDRQACRERAQREFSIPAMIARYEDCYMTAIGGTAQAAARFAASASSRSSTSALLA